MNTDHHSTHCISMRAACQYFDREAKPLAQVAGPAHPISFNDAVDIRIRGTPSSGFQDKTVIDRCVISEEVIWGRLLGRGSP